MACEYALNLVREHGKNESKYYRGRDCIEIFCEDLNKIVEKIHDDSEKRNDFANR